MTYLTPEEIAAKLRVDISTVRRWIRSGQLASIRVGRQYRISQAEYDRFVTNGEVTPQREAQADLVLAR